MLVIQLKRFGSTRWREKAGGLVDFPLAGLDLTAHALDSRQAAAEGLPLYDLYAVTNHFGSLHGGHYTAFAKNPADSHWCARGLPAAALPPTVARRP